jgi:hypothetical protein
MKMKMSKKIENFYIKRIADRIEEHQDTWQFQMLVDAALNENIKANHLISRLLLAEDQQVLIEEIGHAEIDRLMMLAQDRANARKSKRISRSSVPTSDEIREKLVPILNRIARL